MRGSLAAKEMSLWQHGPIYCVLGQGCIGHFSSSLRWSCAAGKPDAARDVARRVEALESTFESELDSFKVDVVACLDLLVCESEKSVRDLVGQVQLWAPTSADRQNGFHQLRNSAASLSFSVSSVRDGCVALDKPLETTGTSKDLQRVRVDHHVRQRRDFCQTILERHA